MSNSYRDVFNSSATMDDSTVCSDDDDLMEGKIYNKTITCITNFNTYNNMNAPGAWMSTLAREYVSNKMGHLLPERFAESIDEVLFIRWSQVEVHKERAGHFNKKFNQNVLPVAETQNLFSQVSKTTKRRYYKNELKKKQKTMM